MMKKQRSLAIEAKKEQDLIWEIMQLILAREKEQHGNSVIQVSPNADFQGFQSQDLLFKGRDGGSECIKSQLGKAKMIRQLDIDEIVQVISRIPL